MRTLLERPCALAWAVLCPFIAAALDTTAYAAPDSTTHPPERILFVGNLNFDCFPDTVTGSSDGSLSASYLPHVIRWGRPPLRIIYDSTTGHRDTLLPDLPCLGAIPWSRRLPITTLRYPTWGHFSGSVAFNRMNDDSLDDMTLFVRGTVGDSLGQTDTLRALTVFSQEGIDTLAVLDLAAIDGFQVAPFFAMELRKGSELVEPDVRDLSGITSYVLQPVSFDVGGHRGDSTGAPGDSTPAHMIRVRVFPNPTGGSAQVAVDSIPPGEYAVDVVAVNGLLYLHQNVTVSMAGTLFQTLDLSALPTGYYVVRVSGDNHLFGLYPIIITH